jgi:hypothetical protein
MEKRPVPTHSMRLNDVITAAHALSLEELDELERWISFRRARQQQRLADTPAENPAKP